MSHIPNSAMPHATDTRTMEGDQSAGLSHHFERFAEMARSHPKTAAAAGAAMLAGVAAAAAMPFMRARSAKPARKSRSRGRKSS
jgi:hypothetical protein